LYYSLNHSFVVVTRKGASVLASFDNRLWKTAQQENESAHAYGASLIVRFPVALQNVPDFVVRKPGRKALLCLNQPQK